MPGPLLHQPAEVIAKVIVELGLGATGSTTATWPVWVGNLPDLPDNCIAVYDSAAISDGRYMLDGERKEFHGFQVMVRATTKRIGYQKLRAIAVALDKRLPGDPDSVYQREVILGITSYCLHSANRTTDVLDLGFEKGTSKRILMTINGVASIRLRD